jgi:hypothetical protein
MAIKRYVIKFVSDLRQVDDFLRVLWFPPPLKLIATEILLKAPKAKPNKTEVKSPVRSISPHRDLTVNIMDNQITN